MSRKPKNEREMTGKMRVFVAEYLRTLNGKRAAIAAGYSKASAVDTSKTLMRHAFVREAINQGLQEREQEIKDRAVKAMEHAYCQATADIGDLFDAEGQYRPINELPARIRRAVLSVEMEYFTVLDGLDEHGEPITRRIAKVAKIKLHDKRASQELLLKYAGKLKDVVQLDATMNYAEMVLAAQRKREEDGKQEEPAKP